MPPNNKNYLFINIFILFIVFILFRISIFLVKKYYNFSDTLTIDTTNKEDDDDTKEHLSDIHSMTNTTNKTLSLIEYVIKSSYNSAYNSELNTISIKQLTSVINQGCRWLDFEIYSINQEPEVGYSSLSSFNTVQSSNTMPFNILMNTINSNAFSSPCPNPLDPLFINLRIKTSNIELFPLIKTAIKSSFEMSLYREAINPLTTILSDLNSSVIIVVDIIHSTPEFASAQSCDNILPNCKLVQSLDNIVHLKCGTSDFTILDQDKLNSTSLIHVLPDGVNTDVTLFQCILPIPDKNPDLLPIISHGIQISPFHFDLVDTNLSKYNSFFNTNGKVAFVPLAKSILSIAQMD